MSNPITPSSIRKNIDKGLDSIDATNKKVIKVLNQILKEWAIRKGED